MQQTRLIFDWQDGIAACRYRSAVSLHGHTMHSREQFTRIQKNLHAVPVVSKLVRDAEKRYRKVTGKELDFGRLYWNPPLTPVEARRLERVQIEERLGLQPLIALTDHDDIEGPLQLRTIGEYADTPISFEWSFPYEDACFHIGVYNLPPESAREIFDRLVQHTIERRHESKALFKELSSCRETLVVLNHPLWDEAGVGPVRREQMLRRFLGAHREWIHALELNGIRSWTENLAVLKMADDVMLPVIAGGDRHGTTPNAVLSLTRASTFSEFVGEMRAGESESAMILMPAYREPARLRRLETIWEVCRDYPQNPETRRTVLDRVFYVLDDGSTRALSTYWDDDGPDLVGLFRRLMRLLEAPRLRPILRAALSLGDEIRS